MIKLYIKEKKGNTYFLLNEKNGKKYALDLVFHSKETPVAGDSITLHQNLLNSNSPEYCQPYFFGELEDKTGHLIDQLTDMELISWKHKGKSFLLKRLYG